MRISDWSSDVCSSDLLVEVLAATSALPVIEARPGAAPRPGTVHVAPGGYHLLIEDDRRFSLSVDARVRHVRPSVDVLFSSAADACGAAVVGIVLKIGRATRLTSSH